ncbi:phage tail tape measure protein [Mycobacterium kyogaense]|uniref:phage tail tape measure protein n=1 Tax=Mycobacterium kyogaense TaxID=2212479 RepID=UPI000DAE29EA|nr:phage tail tape measure protein [Mycobacterium kyogaense]
MELASAWATLAISTKGAESDIRRMFQRAEKSAKLSPTIDTSKMSADADTAGRKFGERFTSASESSLNALKSVGGSGGAGAGAAFLEGFGDKVSSLGSKAGPIGVALAAAAGVGMIAGKAIADEVFAGMEQAQAQANIQAKLGISAPAMKQLADGAGKAYANNFGESIAGNMDAARVAIQSGLLPAGASSDSTRAMIEQLSTVSSVLGEEIPATARSAQQAIQTGLVPNATAAFDLLVRAQQKGINKSGDLLDTVNEYGTQFRKLGLDGPSAFGLISQAMEGGARDSDVAADALKEFSIRAIDGSKQTTDAYTALGLNADETSEKIARGGPVARTAFGQVLDAVRGVKDPVQQSQIAVALFGTQAEDLGAAFQRFDLSTAVQQFGQVQGAAQRASDTVGGTALSSWQTFMRTIETARNGLQQNLGDAFGPLVKQFADAGVSHKAEIIGFFTDIGDAALAFGQVGIKSVGMVMESFGQLAGGLGNVVGGILKTGSLLQRITGDTETADQWNREAEAAFSWGESLKAIGREAKDFNADKIRDQIREAGEQAEQAAKLTSALGESVAALPDGKTITIADNSPETITRLRALGIEVEQTPTGLKLTATTDEAERVMNAWRRQQGGEPVDVTVSPTIDPAAQARFDAFARNFKAALSGAAQPPPPNLPAGTRVAPPAQPGTSITDMLVPPRAAGAIAMADGGLRQIAKPGLADIYAGRGVGTIFAEKETGGEAYIPLAPGKRERSTRILSEVARLFGLQVMEDGGITVNALKQLASQATGGKYVRGGPPGPTGTDCSGLQSWIANALTGGSGRFATGTEGPALLSRGF